MHVIEQRFRFHLLTCGFVAGLVLKLWMLSYMGTADMSQYHEWGEAALERGLPISFRGIYFPLQYQFFQLCSWIVSNSGIHYVIVFKLSNLIFDIGIFILLIVLLQRFALNVMYSLLYWFHPWFLAVFSLGYIDFHFTFFVLLTIVLLRTGTAKNYLLSGIPLGMAFLMKPQVQILMVAAFFYACWAYIRTRNVATFALFVFPFLLYGAYNLYFFIELFPRHGFYSGYILTHHYLNIANVSSSLTAHFPNIWYLPAYLMKLPDQPIYAVQDHLPFLPFRVRYIAGLVVLLLIAIYARKVEELPQWSVMSKVVTLFTFATVTLCFIMTSAHENHLFLGTVLLVLFLAHPSPRSFRIAIHVLLLIQCMNIYGLYGEQPAVIARLLRGIFTELTRILYSLVSVVAYVIFFIHMWDAPRWKPIRVNLA